MKGPFAAFRRSSSEPTFYSSGDGLRTPGSIAPDSSAALSSSLAEEHLRSLGFSPGRPKTLPSGSAAPSAQSSSTILVKIHDWTASFFGCGGSSVATAARSPSGSPAANLLGEFCVSNSSMRGVEEGGSRGETTSASPGTKSLTESETVPINAAPAAATAPASADVITTAGDKKEVTKSRAALSTGAMEEKEYVWANNYRPSVLDEFICNRNQALELHKMVNARQCSHLIFEGPPGVGKKTMVLATLRGAFGPENLKMQIEQKRFELKGEFVASIEVILRKSSRHVEVNLSDLHGYEKHVLVALIDDSHTPHKQNDCDHSQCKVVVLHEADKLSTDAQHYVCWLMEKYKGCNKIFFSCSDASKLHTIRPLCKIIKLQPPSDKEIIDVLEFIARKESIDLPNHMAKKFAENSKHNLRQAIRSFEASWKSSYSLQENQDILTGWEDDIASIAKGVVEEQSPNQLYIIRGKLKNLIEHDVSPDFIFSILVDELKKHLDVQLQAKIDDLYREYKNAHHKEEDSGKKSSDLKKNVRYFMKIEEFTAKFMSLYKSVITKNAAGPKYENKAKQCF